MKGLFLTTLILLLTMGGLSAQESVAKVNQEGKSFADLKHTWTAQWITHPFESTLDYGVFLFRNSFDLQDKPLEFKVYVSADNRYRLFVNGESVCFGPALGDIDHHRYESIDIAPFLKKGQNIIAAQVVNFGEYRRAAQQTFQTAFIIQAEASTGQGEAFNTGSGSWKVTKNQAYKQIPFTSDSLGGAYYCAGPGENMDASLYPWGWEMPGYDDAGWENPKSATVEFAVGRGFLYGSTWFLVPREIPMQREELQRFPEIVRLKNLDHDDGFIKGDKNTIIPPHTSATLLLDNRVHSTGYPELVFSEGGGASIKVTYAEALFLDSEEGKVSSGDHFDSGDRKGDRNLIEGKRIMGYYDLFVADGGQKRKLKTLSRRTFRYVQFEIETRDEALVLNDYYNVLTTYPFEEKASFNGDDPQLDQIWEAAWRTVQNSSGENFFDPYYEQLNYIGDARIEALVSLYVSGDKRLMQKSVKQFDDSRLPEGLTQSRYPSYIVQIIPTYSLLWIGMIHDLLMYTDDPGFTRQFLPGVESVLGWFEERIDSTGMVTDLEWWNFTDWAFGFSNGIPPGADDGYSANVSLQLVYALQNAVDLFAYFGEHEKAKAYESLKKRVQASTLAACYNKASGLIAETPGQEIYSQHTNIWAILTNTIQEQDQEVLMEKILNNEDMIQTTIYFKFYLFRALQKSGMGDSYLDMLDPWNRMLDKGMTTFGERDLNPRSECHGWSASPCFDLLHTVAGIYPGSPGFETVQIEPRLGLLQSMDVKFPHPSGMIMLSLSREGDSGIKGTIELPEKLSGEFLWEGQKIALKEGENQIRINP